MTVDRIMRFRRDERGAAAVESALLVALIALLALGALRIGRVDAAAQRLGQTLGQAGETRNLKCIGCGGEHSNDQ